jgi:hypothetical protein
MHMVNGTQFTVSGPNGADRGSPGGQRHLIGQSPERTAGAGLRFENEGREPGRQVALDAGGCVEVKASQLGGRVAIGHLGPEGRRVGGKPSLPYLQVPPLAADRSQPFPP